LYFGLEHAHELLDLHPLRNLHEAVSSAPFLFDAEAKDKSLQRRTSTPHGSSGAVGHQVRFEVYSRVTGVLRSSHVRAVHVASAAFCAEVCPQTVAAFVRILRRSVRFLNRKEK
jgi:hypothetical protein